MTWILTASGKRLDFLNPQPDQIDILDIAQGLANECRFTGQCRAYYSVAQHSYLASYEVMRINRVTLPKEEQKALAIEALLHDASEAYLKDIPTPLKRLLPAYREIEARLTAIIRAKFGLPEKESDRVKHVDWIMLATERRDLMPCTADDWGIPEYVRPMSQRINAVHAGAALAMFHRRYLELTSR